MMMMTTIRNLRERAATALAAFVRMESAGGLVLLVTAALGMVVANSPFADAYLDWLSAEVGGTVVGLDLEKTVSHWINDGLMVLFFLVVGLELKRELVEGQFADRSQLVLPLACALGGMLVPMGIYAAMNHGDAVRMAGVAIPAATDIAFALGILSLLGSRVPLSLKMLLTAIAVLDDLGAIIIIAVFYTNELSVIALAVAGVVLGLLVALNRAGVKRLWPYLLLGVVLWLAVLKSGVHATLAGVALAMTIPLSSRDGTRRPLDLLEHALHRWVAFAIVPIFAFANAGVPLAGLGLDALLHPVSLGVAAGLVLGKPIGVFGAAWLCVASGWRRLPNGVAWLGVFGMSVLCGIGFTMSLFIGSLAFTSGELQVESRLGILAASVVAALAGLAVLAIGLPRGERRAS